MKKYLLAFILLLAMETTFAQPGKKPPAKEKPPTQSEMEKMMKEAQMEMDNMDPETKQMMDSMGIKMPSVKNIPKVTDKQLADAYEDEMRIVPKKDAARIAAISTVPLSKTSIATFLSSVQNKVTVALKPESKTLAEKIYAELKTSYPPSAIGNAAAALWITGKNELALYIMGNACTDDATNTDNLNNYAAMLSMNSGEHLAIPVLKYLNTKFPGNSTILNNLGQAWFGLGDILKAEKYLDSAIRIYAMHPQATLTKASIEESKGNKDRTVELIKKSISHAYTTEKEDRLRKNGYKLKGADLNLPQKTKTDYLALEKFSLPPFPKSVADAIKLEPVWKQFREELESKRAALKLKIENAKENAVQALQNRTNKNMAMINASMAKGSPQGVLISLPLYGPAAIAKMADLLDPDGRLMYQVINNGKKINDFMNNTGIPLGTEYKKNIERLTKEENEQSGEGKANKDYCPQKKDVTDKFLNAYYGEYEKLVNESLKLEKQKINELVYLNMYAQWPEDYEMILLELKDSWLHTLHGYGSTDFQSYTIYQCVQTSKKEGGKLSEFDDVACQYSSELNLIVFKMTSDCSRTTTEFDAKFLKFRLKQDMDKKTFGDQFMNCTIQIKGGVAIGEGVKMGPAEASAKAEAGVKIEIDRTGVTDVSIIAGVKGGIGINNEEGKVKFVGAGIESKISIITGNTTLEGKGILSTEKNKTTK